MKSVLKPLMLAGLMAGFGFSALAQSGPTAPAGGMGGPGGQHRMHGKGPMDPARMEEHMAKRQAVLKVRLKVTADQEGAWTTFTNAMKPSPDMLKRRADMRAEMDKLTTPERMDKMKALRGERDAQMDKHAAAVKTFYAVLTPEQKKVFDAQHMRGGHERGPGGRMAPPPAKS